MWKSARSEPFPGFNECEFVNAKSIASSAPTMKSNCLVFVSCLVMACLTSCSTGAKRELAQAGGGLATVSALVVALPLIPVAGVHQLVSSGGSGAKRERAAERELEALLDPIYHERT